MALTQRQMACFEKNPQFLREVAAALLKIAAGMKAEAIVTRYSESSTAVEKEIAAIKESVAGQILAEQGINLSGSNMNFPGVQAASGTSVGMSYLVQHMLGSSNWTLTPDAWANDEPAARTAIFTGMVATLTDLMTVPQG